MAALLCTGCADVFRYMTCCCPEDGASPIFLVFTLGCHAITAPLVVIASIMYSSDSSCSEDMTLFGPLQLLCSLFFIAYAVHLYKVFSLPYASRFGNVWSRSGTYHHNDNNTDSHEGPCERLFYVFMFDPWTLVFFMVSVFQIIWIVMGYRWVDQYDNSSCPSFMTGTIKAACATAIIHLALGAIIIIFTTLVDTCQHEESSFDRTFGLTNSSSTTRRSTSRGNADRHVSNSTRRDDDNSNPFAALEGQGFFEAEIA